MIERLIQEITTAKVSGDAVIASQQERLVKSYQQLLLMIKAHQQTTSEQLIKIRTGKKTIRAYRPI
jgi:hypothetical protein